VEVETPRTTGLRQASDAEQLAHAACHQRVAVTYHVRHSPRIPATWMNAAQAHGGIIILLGQAVMDIWLRRREPLLQRFSVEE
jgi:hypothetical protein